MVEKKKKTTKKSKASTGNKVDNMGILKALNDELVDIKSDIKAIKENQPNIDVGCSCDKTEDQPLIPILCFKAFHSVKGIKECQFFEASDQCKIWFNGNMFKVVEYPNGKDTPKGNEVVTYSSLANVPWFKAKEDLF